MMSPIFDQISRNAENSSDKLQLRAKNAIVETLQLDSPEEHENVTPEDLHIVWFSKILKNWKALVFSDRLTGLYFEVTHNGEKQETYVDTYVKHRNNVVHN